MIDWKHIFELAYKGEALPAKWVSVSASDQEWVQSEIKKVSFDENDSLKLAVDKLKELSKQVLERSEQRGHSLEGYLPTDARPRPTRGATRRALGDLPSLSSSPVDRVSLPNARTSQRLDSSHS